ncbi:MAG: hypothetical protein Kow0025_19540 [Thermodesulfovibrionales bacterium]
MGKSFFSSNLACALAYSGKRVILMDADLGGANLNIMFGIRHPRHTLGDFLARKVSDFGEVLVPTGLENLHLICGASDVLELANPSFHQKEDLLKAISSLQADLVIIDVGAGASHNNLDFFNMADMGIIVTSPSPTAIQNAYGFLKMAVNRRVIRMYDGHTALGERVASALGSPEGARSIPELLEIIRGCDLVESERLEKALLDKRYRLVVNMATEAEGDKISKTISSVAYQFLRVKVTPLGAIAHAVDVERSIRRMTPVLLSAPQSAVSAALKAIAARAVPEAPAGPPQADARSGKGSPGPGDAAGARAARHEKPGPPENRRGTRLSLNDDVRYQGRTLHVQTEDLGPEKGKVLTLVFSGGHILFSRSTDYEEMGIRTAGEGEVHERVKRQHRTVIAGISSGKLNDRIPA